MAGLAAAAVLAERDFAVQLFESKSQLGGRAGGFRDAETGEMLDHCQHVSMGCCTNLADFCRRTGAGDFVKSDRLTFIDPDGGRHTFAASQWLPAPMHLGPALLGLRFLSLSERIGVARCMQAIAKSPAQYSPDEPTIGEWLVEQKQSPHAIETYWKVILVSALSESLDRISFSAARQVFVEGFMANHRGWVMETPTLPLNEMYDGNVAKYLEQRGVEIHRSKRLKELHAEEGRVTSAMVGDEVCSFDYAILALPRPQTLAVLPAEAKAMKELAVADFPTAPISSVHLWYREPITDLPHAVFVDCTSQWLFAKENRSNESGSAYYQVVVSAAHAVNDGNRAATESQVLTEQAKFFPKANEEALVRCKTVTQHHAVFSTLPGVEDLRATQATPLPNLFLAGDWTKTGWPSTMEGAVRSGYLAAESLLRSTGEEAALLVDDLPSAWLTRRLTGS